MCGVAGIFSYHTNAPKVEHAVLHNICEYMAKRGPDSKGEWYSDNGRVALGHRRLSIIDLSDKAKQPMQIENGNLIICFNGEIYNYRELRKKLELNGHVFSSDSDTEVILHLYADRGEKMLHELRGMFSIVLWDNQKQSLLLARDPFGIKPLYYEDDGHTVTFASQVKALLAGDKVLRNTDPAGIVGFLMFGSVPEPYTCYQNVKSIPAGSYMWITNSGLSSPVNYCSLNSVWGKQQQKNNFEILLRESLLDSVWHHQIADVPVGAFLSSGIDSITLLALMKESRDNNDQEIKTITLTFEEYKNTINDEAPLATEIARQLGTSHINRMITKNEFETCLPKILHAMDQPSIDGINTWFVSKIAAEQGLKVAISGLGGDELFGSYPSFRDVPLWHRYIGPISRIGKPLSGFMKTLMYRFIPPKILALLDYADTLTGAYFVRRGLFMPWEITKIIDKDLATSGLEKLNPINYLNALINKLPSGASYATVSTLEASHYMRNQLLRDADWAGMDHSLEIRVPLVDIRLWSNIANQLIALEPGSAKKMLLKSTNLNTAEKIMYRPKTGFSVPYENWIIQQPEYRIPDKNMQIQSSNWHWSRKFALQILQSFKLI